MKREELIRLLANLEVIKAFVDGHTVQVKIIGSQTDVWSDYNGDVPNFTNSMWEWRVKPTPREFWLTGNGDCGYREAWDKRPPGPHFIHVREVTP